jgi:hypothetical protein
MTAHRERAAHVDEFWLLAGKSHQIVYGLEWRRSMHDQSVRVDLRARDHLQVLGLEARRGFAEQCRQRDGVGGDGVAVGRRADQRVDHDDAGTAGAVFDHHVLTELRGQQLRHDAGVQIYRRARCRPAQYGDRTRRILLRLDIAHHQHCCQCAQHLPTRLAEHHWFFPR